MYKVGCQTTNQPSNFADEGRSVYRRIMLEKEEEFWFNTILYFWSEMLPYIWIDWLIIFDGNQVLEMDTDEAF